MMILNLPALVSMTLLNPVVPGSYTSTGFSQSASGFARSSAGFSTDGVVGHTYITTKSTMIPPGVDCNRQQGDIYAKLVDVPAFDEHFAYDYLMLCAPYDSQSSTLIIDLTIEPKTSDDIHFLESYVAARQDMNFKNITIHFDEVTRIDIRKSVAAQFTKNHSWSNVSFSYDMGETAKLSFDNFATFQNHMHSEAAAFFVGESLSPMLDHLSQYFSAQAVENFRELGLKKANLVRTSNPRYISLRGKNAIDGLYVDGAFRECFTHGAEMCAQ